MIPKGSSMATGLITWTFPLGLCKQDEANIESVELVLTTCSDLEFTCQSGGGCVPMENKCDKYPNCMDRSDELDCSAVIKGKSYQSEFAPIVSNDDGSYKKAKILLALNLIEILDIDEKRERFATKFLLSLKWFDPRLNFRNLKNKTAANKLVNEEMESVWIPQVIFVNTPDFDVSKDDEKAFALINRTQQAVFSPLEELTISHLYKGGQNSLNLKRAYSTVWICNYNVKWFPFDTQVCTLQFQPEGNSANFLELGVDSLQYSGSQQLTQYFVKKTLIYRRESDEAIVIEVHLSRPLLGTFLTIFIPTILMIIISQATNYFSPIFFEGFVTVNLTIMLVLTTMFLSVSESLPSTSYVKMIDIWLLFNLTVPFICVLLNTYIDHLRNIVDVDGEPRKSKFEFAPKEPTEDPDGTIISFETKIRRSRAKPSDLVTKVSQITANYPWQDDDLNIDDVYDNKNGFENTLGAEDAKSVATDRARLNRCLLFVRRQYPVLILGFMISYWVVGGLKYRGY